MKGFLIKQKNNNKIAETTKTVQLPVKKPSPTHFALLAAGNATIYNLEKTKLNKNSAIEIAIIETRKL